MACTIVYFHRLAFPSESGQTIQVVRDYGALAELGHFVHLFYRSPDALALEVVDQALRHYGVTATDRVHLHLVREGSGGGARLRQSVSALVADVGGEVVLVTRTLDHAAAALKVRQLFVPRVRVVLELHETAIPHMVFREQGRRMRAWMSKRVEQRVFAAVDGIVSTVGSQLALLDQQFPGHAPVVVLPNGVWPNAPARERMADGTVHLRYAGQLGGWKNTDVMIEALSHLPDEVILEIAGGKAGREEETRRQLEAVAARSAAAGRVHYVGVLEPDAVPSFLAKADVLLLPLGENVQSRYFTSPMKLFEYAASGVPMVVTRQPTTESLVRHEEHALMVAPNSARALADAVARLIADPAIAERLASNAASWVREYSYPQRARRYEAFLHSLFAASA